MKMPGRKDTEKRFPGILMQTMLVLVSVFLFAVGPAAVSFGQGAGEGAVPAPAPSQDAEFDAFSEFSDVAGGGEEEVYDPMAGYNRVMTKVNDRLYFWALKPAAQAYGAVVPEGARVSVKRFFKNLAFPVRFANNLLQGKFKGAGVEALRFGVNTTIGIAGLWDPASDWLGLSAREEDFGQTLGRYGMEGGFHLVLPLFGPSNFRDSLGRIPDSYLDPLTYLADTEIQAGASLAETVNKTSLRIGEYESLRKDAMDLYILFRSAYEQNRKREIEE
jgi:phospholipid-binding lipoprotein MlaA